LKPLSILAPEYKLAYSPAVWARGQCAGSAAKAPRAAYSKL
jgi:hypothetical protein